ncbi:hypothetical protein [Spiroplasma monobiae]|uniref:Uncharacterized protein n=1 Tax=Spiroplasma monobiae MQ-1 TaxID=1336748 RepID=A0A2K9LUI8_SPISQ|nr:hypothetical protein [Spiroplasma monobiae]AUM62581.1 hypothetical protein SMONO_v1c03320 [Spiroplasma monobiae MQ-1]
MQINLLTVRELFDNALGCISQEYDKYSNAEKKFVLNALTEAAYSLFGWGGLAEMIHHYLPYNERSNYFLEIFYSAEEGVNNIGFVDWNEPL